MSRIAPRLALGDRLRTIAVTAIVTSVAWLVFGAGAMDAVGNLAVLRKLPDGSDRLSSSHPTGKPLHKTPTAPRSQFVAGEYLMPVAGIRPEQLTDTFTDARAGGARIHDAIDIMAPRGTPVFAAVSGTVEKLFTSDAGGLTIYVRSPDRRTITYYAHLDAYQPGLAERQQVRRGQQLGTVGFSGNADPAAPHLHFAIMRTTPEATWSEPSIALNPYPALTGRGR